jgi:Tol biopolymer transport system component
MKNDYSLCLILGFASALRASDAGKDWGIERVEYTDPISQVRVAELSSHATPADNLYFHFSNFTADNRYLIFVSERTGSAQIYRADIESGRIIQLTDDPAVNARGACPDPSNPRRLYYLRGPAVYAMDLWDFGNHKVGEIPKPYLGGFQQPTVSPDGRWLTMAKQRDQTNWEIGLMDTATGAYRTVITQGFRITHVQHSPKDNVIFYVWETGGYAPQRTWLVNDDGTGNRPFYARIDPKTWFTQLKEWVTHEAWVKNTGDMTMVNDKLGIMLVQPDGTARIVREGNYWHAAASPDGRWLVADDMQGRLWLIETASGTTRLLATGIRDSVKTVHAHPSFDRQGNWVQFHSGRTHETVALIDLRSLPAARPATP